MRAVCWQEALYEADNAGKSQNFLHVLLTSYCTVFIANSQYDVVLKCQRKLRRILAGNIIDSLHSFHN